MTSRRLPDAPCRCAGPTCWAPLAYLLLAGWVLAGLIGNLRTGYLSQGVQDQQAFEWYFGAAAHNLTSLSNPLFSDLQNFPAGVNLMANAAVLGLGLPLAPLTLLAGPSVTFLVVELLGLALTASAWFWLFRRHLAVHPLAAAIGAGFIGFAPGMVSHANGHPNFVAQFLVPLLVDRVLRLAEGHRPVRDGVVLGLLAAWQVFIGEEVLLLTALGLAVGAVVYLAHGQLPCAGCCRAWAPLRASASRSSRCRCGGSSPARRATATSTTPRRATTSPSCGGGPPAASAPTRGPPRPCR